MRATSGRVPLLASAVIFAAAFASCGGSGNVDDDDAREEELDLAALVSAAFEEEPRRLPSGAELDRIDIVSGWDRQQVAEFIMYFSGAGKEYSADVAVYREAAQARAALEDEADLWEAAESAKERGHYCYWDEDSFFIDAADFSACFGRSGNVLIETEVGPIGSDKPEAGLDFLLAIETFFDRLAKDATSRVHSLKPAPLAALLASIPPPPFPGRAVPPEAEVLRDEESAGPGLIAQVRWPGDTAQRESTFFVVFKDEASADAYRRNFSNTRGATSCAAAENNTFRFCVNQVDETVVLAQRLASGPSAPASDPELQRLTDDVVKHLDDLRGGKLPRAPAASKTPTGKRTPTASPSTPTPTATPVPPVARFNAGRWTFDMVVKTNDCAGGQPPPGAKFTLQFTFADASGDGYVYPDESFSIRQTLPGPSNAGAVYAKVPTTTFSLEVRSGAVVGYAQVALTFTDEDLALIEYKEFYSNCTITAE